MDIQYPKKEHYDPKLPPRKRFKGELIGEISGIISVIAWIPLAWTVMKTENVSGLDLPLMLIQLTAIMLGLYFAWANGIIPNIITGMGIGTILIFLISCKIIYQPSNT